MCLLIGGRINIRNEYLHNTEGKIFLLYHRSYGSTKLDLIRSSYTSILNSMIKDCNFWMFIPYSNFYDLMDFYIGIDIGKGMSPA